ncbi:MAG: PVC-type heme-binding CxxCH protein, partial [Planctomycetota bacterium]
DGRFDERQVWFQGFSTGNEQLRANHPRLGPDGLVYVASGLRGGSIRAVHEDWNVDMAPTVLDLAGYDFCFDPQGGFWGRATGQSQFGLTIDDFGTRVGCSNRNPAMQSILPYEFVAASNEVNARDAYRDIALAGADSRVVAATKTWTTSNLHEGQFSSACGVTLGMGKAFPADWRSSLLICEPTSYAVQRQNIESNGITPVYRRSKSDREFLSSSNRWFRPVDLCNGPDGALYIVDMCRAVIEHPDWAPPELKERPDERDGDRCGRIWRVSHGETGAGETGAGGRLAPVAVNVASWLDSTNVWHREIATRRLYEAGTKKVRADSDVSDLLTYVESAAGQARVLQWMSSNQLLTPELITGVVDHSDPRLRRLAARLTSRVEDLQARAKILKRLFNDADLGVRFEALQVAILVGDAIEFAPAIAALIASTVDSAWMHLVKSLDAETAHQVLMNWPSDTATDAENAVKVVQSLSRRAASVGLLPVRFEGHTNLAIANVAGWMSGQSPSTDWAEATSEVAYVAQAIELARSCFADLDESEALLLCAWSLVERVGEVDQRMVRMVLAASRFNSLSNASIRWWLKSDLEGATTWMIQHFAELQAWEREAWLRSMVNKEESARKLVSAIVAGQLAASLIPPAISNRLESHLDAELASQAKRIFSTAKTEAALLLRQYESATRGLANLERGRKLFQTHCASCHRIDSKGVNVGPDISDSRTKTPSYLLTAILSPNASIDGVFQAYRCLTVDDQIHVGLIVDRNESELTLRVAGGEEVRISMPEIAAVRSTAESLMPTGFDRVLDVDSMRDLIGYLKGGRYSPDSSELGNSPLSGAVVEDGQINLEDLQ